jgi:metallo-beta-lactamase family protein
VLIPAFAVDRTEVLLHHLGTLAHQGRLPDVPVFVDSPLALAALRIYREATLAGDPDLRADARARLDVARHLDLREIHDVEESKALNTTPYPCIVISASGMATGGRVVHHLFHRLPDPRTTVVLVGFQAKGTRGRSLADGAKVLKMLGRYVRVRAEIVTLAAFSVHADQDGLVGWLRQLPTEPRSVFVVHGEPEASRALADRIDDELGWLAVVPRLGERVRLE